jgi:serine protease AprX
VKRRWYCLLLQAALFSVLFVGVRVNPVNAQDRYWIEFSDKGQSPFRRGLALYDSALARLTPACRQRRARAKVPIVSILDAPIYLPYLDSLRIIGIAPLRTSRWTNAVSAELSSAAIARLNHASFVRSILPVRIGRIASYPRCENTSQVFCTYDPIISNEGASYLQLANINALPLQAMGLDGTGVHLGFMDTGFRWRTMSSLMNAKIDSEYDYVFRDSVTADEPADVPGQDNHGSATLATAIGYEAGQHAGAAHNATVFLAKTEDLRSETPREEDNLAEALEDMEAWGVDVTSTSLGYLTFDSGWTSHTYADLNGKTTVAARAAARAASLGVIVVSAMGNGGGTAEPHMISPADADSILSVGGLDELGNHAGFSSVGPTSDGRIKPDICAQAASVHSQGADGQYGFFGGTSFATPLVSSACCLIRQAHPNVSAETIREAVRETGSNAATPDTLLGWGELNSYAAALQVGDVLHEMDASYDTWLSLCLGAASKFGVGHIIVEYSTRTGGTQTRPLFLVADSLIYSTQIDAEPNTLVKYRYLETNRSGTITYLPDTGYYSFQTSAGHELVADAYPNPVSGTEILRSNEPVDWQLFDATGREVRSGVLPVAGTQAFSVRDLPSAAYFLILRARTGASISRKIFILH